MPVLGPDPDPDSGPDSDHDPGESKQLVFVHIFGIFFKQIFSKIDFEISDLISESHE